MWHSKAVPHKKFNAKILIASQPMLLLQFSTSHYCRKARLALGFKKISYRVENLTPGIHSLKVKPLTGTTTLPVLFPEKEGQPTVIGDSTRIFQFLEAFAPDLPFVPENATAAAAAWTLEDWLDESIGIATRFVYYDFRSGAGKQLDPSLSSQLVIQMVRWQSEISPARVQLARERLEKGLVFLGQRWQESPYLVGDRLSIADLAAAALLSPLARIPSYREGNPWLFQRITEVHQHCGEPLPPGL